MTTVSQNDEPTCGIRAVSRLTGIPLDTLRVWERRYSLVKPPRTSDNKRQYSRTDVTRLKLIKQLVDRGHAINSVAHLSEQALQERWQIHLEAPPTPLRSHCLYVPWFTGMRFLFWLNNGKMSWDSSN